VSFNRHTNQWEARNGQTFTFPAGPEGKRQALRLALSHDHPPLAQVVQDLATQHAEAPALVDRLFKAAQLLVKGHVYSNGRVQSQSGSDLYQTSFSGTPKLWHCSCLDFENGMQREAGLSERGGVDTDYGLMCKHTLAHLLAYLTSTTLPHEPIPFGQRDTALRQAQDAALPAWATDHRSIEDFLG
jgi:hypothetical protein